MEFIVDDVIEINDNGTLGFLLDINTNSLAHHTIEGGLYEVSMIAKGVVTLFPVKENILLVDRTDIVATIPLPDDRIIIAGINDLSILKIFRAESEAHEWKQVYPEPKRYVRCGRGMMVYEVIRVSGDKTRVKTVTNGRRYWLDNASIVEHVQPKTISGIENNNWIIPKMFGGEGLWFTK